jgi:O-Antigen ligase
MSGILRKRRIVPRAEVQRTYRIEWRWFIGLLLFVVLFVPPRRYTFPVSLPFELDPYRLLILVLAFVFLLSALSDERLRLRATGLEAPLALFGIGIAGSLAANPARLAAYQSEVIGTLSVLAGYFIVLYLVVNLVRTREACETALTVLVVGGAVLAMLAVVERKTGWSPFVGMDRYLPFLQSSGAANLQLIRDGAARTFGSAEHPIALGALFAMLVPIAAALAVRRPRPTIWVVCLTSLVIGSFATMSRTSVVMLYASAILLALLRWKEMKRFVPLALASVALINFIMPGTLGSLRASLQPSEVIKQQEANPDSQSSAGRVADFSPSFDQFSEKPVLGYGMGTRIVVGERANARVLDNQWLGTLLDAGLVGIAGLAWLLGRFVTRLSVASFRAGVDGVLLVGLAASVLSYIVSMFTYDALGFTQVTVVLFVVVGIGCSFVLAPDPVMVLEQSHSGASRHPPRQQRGRMVTEPEPSS